MPPGANKGVARYTAEAGATVSRMLTVAATGAATVAARDVGALVLLGTDEQQLVQLQRALGADGILPPSSVRLLVRDLYKQSKFLLSIDAQSKKGYSLRLHMLGLAAALAAQAWLVVSAAHSTADFWLAINCVARARIALPAAAQFSAHIAALVASGQYVSKVQAGAERRLRRTLTEYMELRYFRNAVMRRTLSYSGVQNAAQVSDTVRSWAGAFVSAAALSMKSVLLLAFAAAESRKRLGPRPTAVLLAFLAVARLLHMVVAPASPVVAGIVARAAALIGVAGVTVVQLSAGSAPRGFVGGDFMPAPWWWALSALLVTQIVRAFTQLVCTAVDVVPRLYISTAKLVKAEKGLNDIRTRVVKMELGSAKGTVVLADGALALEGVNVRAVPTSRSSRVIIPRLTLTITPGTNVIINGPRHSGRSSIMRLIGEYFPLFEGTITRPSLNDVVFVAKFGIMPGLTIKQQLVYPATTCTEGESALAEHLAAVGLGDLLERDGVNDGWETTTDSLLHLLVPSELQRLGLARIFHHRPHFALLDEATSDLSDEEEAAFFAACAARHITTVTIATNVARAAPHHTHTLHIDEKGGWVFGTHTVRSDGSIVIQKVLTASNPSILKSGMHLLPTF